MVDPIARVVEPFLSEADAVLGEGYSAVLYGSAARGDFIPGRSDINLLIIADGLAPAVLHSLRRGFGAWRKATREPPLLMTRAEWHRAADAFPIEIADMRAAYRVLRGPDPLRGAVVERGDLRRALEREFRGKLLRLRQGYAAYAHDPAVLGTLAAESAANVLVLLRGLLTLLGRPVPADPVALATAAAAAAGLDGEALVRVVRRRGERDRRCGAPEFEGYMAAVERAAQFLDQLQPGDH